jgi:hypothetical protein
VPTGTKGARSDQDEREEESHERWSVFLLNRATQSGGGGIRCRAVARFTREALRRRGAARIAATGAKTLAKLFADAK